MLLTQSLLWNTYGKKEWNQSCESVFQRCKFVVELHMSVWTNMVSTTESTDCSDAHLIHFPVINAAVTWSYLWGQIALDSFHSSIYTFWTYWTVKSHYTKDCCLPSALWIKCFDSPDLMKNIFIFFADIFGAFQWTTTTFRNNDMYWNIKCDRIHCVEGEDGCTVFPHTESMTFSVLCLLHLSFSIAFLWNILSCCRPFLFQVHIVWYYLHWCISGA